APLLFSYHIDHRYRPSFPTRRSSDLISVSVETPEQLLETASCISEKRVAADRIYINCELLSLFENPERQNAVYEAVHNLKRNGRSEEHTSELQSRFDLVCRLLLEKKK